MILTTANQDVPDLEIVYTDIADRCVEHAYYLQYRNRRPDYVQGWHKLIHWKKAEKRYEQVLCSLGKSRWRSGKIAERRRHSRTKR